MGKGQRLKIINNPKRGIIRENTSHSCPYNRDMENKEYQRSDFKRQTKREKQESAVPILLDKMFEIAGHETRYRDIVGRKDAWYQDWQMTLAQNEEWKSWGINFLKQDLKMRQKQAELEMGMISLNWGLGISDWKDEVG
jgi:hypothetical protein